MKTDQRSDQRWQAGIHYAIVRCALGRLLVAATDKGICRIGLADSTAALERELRKEFHSAELCRGGGKLDSWVRAIVRHLDGKQPGLDLPLDIRGTAFQWRVWKALQSIPYGQTRSYSEIAMAVGKPRAVRAVARACATNPVALIIPCHRVVRKNGDLGGYYWGIARKRSLLDKEKCKGIKETPAVR
jgi:AraC family transcriptional regulator of adaptative response/methylated-DNA-[protein]-cysteine methyltransferase